ncbi:MAG: O-antigen ligase family protein [Candidatus Eisenbacteria bacterium]|nr:O-antigen ligase family protein [Candidatus Eisenbacteria bacterium]
MAAQQAPWPGAPDLQGYVPAAAGAALVVGLVTGELRFRALRMPPALALLLSLGALSALTSPAPWIAIPAFIEKTLWVVGAVLLVSLFSPAPARRAALPVLVLLTFEQIAMALHQSISLRREAWGSLGTPNALARYVLMVWPLVALPLLASGKALLRLSGLLLGGALSVVLVLSSSRMAWVAFSVQWLLIVVRWRPKIGVGVAIAALIGMIVFWHGSLIRADDMQRIMAWKTALALALQHPLLGTGLGTFGSYYQLVPPSPTADALQTPHNLLLHLACELGLMSIPLLMWLMAAGWWHLVSAERRVDRFDGAFLLAARVIIVGLAVQSLVEY